MLRTHQTSIGKTSINKGLAQMATRAAGLAAALATLAIAGTAAAQTTTYVFTSNNYSTLQHASAACVGTDCGTYTTAQRLEMRLVFAAPLAPNLPAADRSADVVSYTIDDGNITTTGHSTAAAIHTMHFGTDAMGKPSNWNVILQRTTVSPFGTGTDASATAAQRVTHYVMRPTLVSANVSAPCQTRDAGTVSNPGAGRCSLLADEPTTSHRIEATSSTAFVTPSPAPVPTLSEWAMILLGTLLAGTAGLMIWRRQQVA